MDFLKNVAVNLKATGLAAIACVWVICLTLIIIFAPERPLTNVSLGIMIFFGSGLLALLGSTRSGDG